MALDPKAVEAKADAYVAAWNSGDPEQVGAHFAWDGSVTINRGTPHEGRPAVESMVAGFMAAVPDLQLTCDVLRVAGDHAVFIWTFTGHDSDTRNPLSISGWDEWNLDDDLLIYTSDKWFDSDDYARQIAGVTT